jgi:hypothetical protein
VPTFTFDALESRYGRGGAVRIFHTLHRLGLADTVLHQEGESDWLDRLAEGVAPGSAGSEWPAEAGEFGPLSSDRDDDGQGTEGAAPVDDQEPEPILPPVKAPRLASELKGVSAPASTTLTDGVYDEIRRLRSRVGDK